MRGSLRVNFLDFPNIFSWFQNSYLFFKRKKANLSSITRKDIKTVIYFIESILPYLCLVYIVNQAII